jgi:hypothetical protein
MVGTNGFNFWNGRRLGPEERERFHAAMVKRLNEMTADMPDDALVQVSVDLLKDIVEQLKWRHRLPR